MRPQLEQWEKLCAELGEEPADVALAWLLHQKGVTGPIIGPRTLEQLDGASCARSTSTLDDDDARRARRDLPRPGRSRARGLRLVAKPRTATDNGELDGRLRSALHDAARCDACKPDPIPIDVQQRILDAAVRAPSGGNTQNWRFMLVDDPDVKAKLGPIYRECLAQLWVTIYKERLDAANANPDDPESAEMLRIQRSAQHLADHFEEYPLLLFSFVQFDPTGGSIFPATWSAMLAAPRRGSRRVADERVRVPARPRARHPRRPEARRLAVLVVRDLRLPDGTVGRRGAPPGARSVVPQSLGRTRSVSRSRTALALGREGSSPN